MPLDQLDDLVVVHVPGRGDDQVGGLVAGAPERVDVLDGEGAHRFLVARDLPAERRVAEEALVEDVVDVLAGVVAVGADLLHDDVALAVDVLGAQQRPDDQLRQDVEGAVRLAPRKARPVDGRLAVGGRVGGAADALDGLRDGLGGGVRGWCP